MDFEAIEALRERHPAWRLVRAQNASLILAFVGGHFVERNRGATPGPALAEALDDVLYGLNAGHEEPRFPRSAEDYLEQWSQAEYGWLRRFYPVGSDEVHYDATPAFERAYSWVTSLQSRTFIGTESRLYIAIELLRQIVQGTETDPATRLERLHRQRAELDEQIARAEAGEEPEMLADAGIRDRYQQFASTARGLLSDFREVEENFRALDRSARERIAGWDGAKGDLLAELVASRSDIVSSDQGSNFQAFYDFLLSDTQQDELSQLLDQVQSLPAVDPDRRLRTIGHDWSEAAERTQQTVRQISEQLRRFLDDQVWLENRRVLDLVRTIESAALTQRNAPLEVGLEVDVPGLGIRLPFERPLYDARPRSQVSSLLEPAVAEELDVSALYAQNFVDHARLAGNIRAVLPPASATALTSIIDMFPIEQGVAEIIGYLALTDEDLTVDLDESEQMVIDYRDINDQPRRLHTPKVTVSRR